MEATTTYLSEHERVLAQLSEWAIKSSIETLRREDKLTLALREALQNGANIDELSALTGLRPDEIRRRTHRNLNVLSELEVLAE